MKYSVKVLLFGVIISLFACDDEQRQSGSTGKLNVRITASGSVTDVTTRSEEVALPSVDDFALTLLQGETVKGSWAKVSDYPEDVTFPVGSYTLKASYGDSDSEGFESPYYEGKSELEIRGGATTDVETICRLANTKISVQYTDDFKSYFKTYSTAIKSEGGSEVTFASNESRAAYVKPGRVTVNVTFTKVNGGLGSTTLEVATIDEALPQHHYHLLMDVDTGKATLTIVFDRVTEEKPIQLDISDQALNIKAPYFTLTGFEKTNDDNNQWDGSLMESKKLSALLTSLGGFKKCILKTTSPNLADWPAEGFDLAEELTAEQQDQLRNSGVKLTGFGKNKDQMAIIDFTGVVPHLNVSDANSEHLFYLEATSTYGKPSKEYILNITTPKNFMLLPANPVKMGAMQVVLPVKLKEGEPSHVELYYKNYGTWKRITNTSYEPMAGQAGYYNFTAKDVNMGFVAKEFAARYNGVESSVIKVAVTVPNYSVTLTDVDMWAHKAIITVIPDDPDDLSNIMKSIEVYCKKDGQWLKTSREKDVSQVIISDLEAGTSYQFKTTCDDGGNYSNEVTGVTEKEFQILDNMTEGWSRYFSGTINKGGKYNHKALGGDNRFDTQTVDFFNIKNDSWSTVNEKTIPLAPKTKNTWYMVPSAINQNNALLLRNVAWSNTAGDPPGKTDWGALTLNDLTPPVHQHYSSGKLFLGKYSYNHDINADVYNPGVEFTSRPQKLVGEYSYTAYNGDKGKVVVKVENRNNGAPITLATGSQDLIARNTDIEVTLNYINTTLKATHIRILFTSSSADDKDDGSVSDAIIKPFVEDHKMEAVAYGSQLIIQKGITLEY